jgi:UDP-2,4-diacetamido-2,4,6-trideoxy-beta-L-altropyranose hydrolase
VTTIALRAATAADCRTVWEINNQSVVRKNAISTDSIPWDAHVVWFNASLGNPDRLLLLGSDERGEFGVIRYDIKGANAVVTVALLERRFGEGLGAKLISESAGFLFKKSAVVEKIIAHVRPSNLSSEKSFLRSGYKFARTEMIDGIELKVFECVKSVLE